MKKIYISGAISGIGNYKEKFQKAESFLKNNGFVEVVNPVKVCEKLFKNNTENISWESLMKIVIGNLLLCDNICMLPDFAESKGAKLEFEIAIALRYTIYFLDGKNLKLIAVGK